MYICIYIYIHTYILCIVCMNIYIYIYIYMVPLCASRSAAAPSDVPSTAWWDKKTTWTLGALHRSLKPR